MLHESMCFKNPVNDRICYQCSHLEKDDVEIYTGIDNYYSSEPIYARKKFFFCQKKQIFLYTPQNEIKRNFNHIDTQGGWLENYPMVNKCPVFKKSL